MYIYIYAFVLSPFRMLMSRKHPKTRILGGYCGTSQSSAGRHSFDPSMARSEGNGAESGSDGKIGCKVAQHSSCCRGPSAFPGYREHRLIL